MLEAERAAADAAERAAATARYSGAALAAVGDLTLLADVSEAEMLEALDRRFALDRIYTFCGPILLAVPFGLLSASLEQNPKSLPLLDDFHSSPRIFRETKQTYANTRQHFLAFGKYWRQRELKFGELLNWEERSSTSAST